MDVKKPGKKKEELDATKKREIEIEFFQKEEIVDYIRVFGKEYKRHEFWKNLNEFNPIGQPGERIDKLLMANGFAELDLVEPCKDHKGNIQYCWTETGKKIMRKVSNYFVNRNPKETIVVPVVGERQIKEFAKNGDFLYIGEIEIESGEVRVTDPCYDLETWCAGTVKNVAKGKWYAYVKFKDVGSWGTRHSQLWIVKEKELLNKSIEIMHHFGICVGVDSGQAGFFDVKYFKDDSDPYLNFKRESNDVIGDCKEPGDHFYSMMCDLTLRRPIGAGTYKHGAVSSSGLGDGSYDAFGYKRGDEWEVLMIDFGLEYDPMEDEEEDEE
jgi:hypothetical protein